MDRYHVSCPKCGRWNENLYLEETGGTFECEECRTVISLAKYKCEDLGDRSQEGI